MKIIVGLGNPGKKYEGTRHNAGFAFIDKLIDTPEFSPVDQACKLSFDKKFNAEIADVLVKGERVILVKPQAYMNLSGETVIKVMNYYKVELDALIVVSDDIDLPVGFSRVRLRGSSGGQKGLQNIIDLLKNDQFIRFRIGINSLDEKVRDDFNAANFVLSQPSERENPLLEQSIEQAVIFLVQFIGSKEPIPAHSLQVKFDSIR